MSRNTRPDREYRRSPLSRQLSNTNLPDYAVEGPKFNPQPNDCACSPQPCNITTRDFLDHNSIYIHYLAMMQSFGISGPSELQSILSGGGRKPELTAQLKTSPSRWVHLGWLKANTISSDDGDTPEPESLIAGGVDSSEYAERVSPEADSDHEMDGGLLERQYTYRDMYVGDGAYGDYRGGPRGHGIYVEDFSDPEENYGGDEYWYGGRRGGRGYGG